MMWVKVDVGFADHPKVMTLSDAAFRVHVAAICWCGRNRTDGFVPLAYGKTSGIRSKLIEELLSSGVWEVAIDGGWLIHDFLAYNPSRDQDTARRAELSEKRALAGRRGAAKRWGKQETADGNADSNVSGNADSNPDGKTDSKPIANRWQDQDKREERDPNTSQPAKDLTGSARIEPNSQAGLPASAPTDVKSLPEKPSVAAITPEASSDSKPPAEPKKPPDSARVVGATTRQRGERPRVVQELPTRASPRDVEVPLVFGQYASELGLQQATFMDVVTDWREKVGPGTHTRIFDVLCRFIETKALKREMAGAPSSSQQPIEEPKPKAWAPPPGPPPDPNPPPPNPLGFPRKVSNG
jgi:hypothetical protein